MSDNHSTDTAKIGSGCAHAVQNFIAMWVALGIAIAVAAYYHQFLP